MKYEKMTPGQLRKIREKLGMSQEALARYLDISSRTVYRWEKGESPIRTVFVRQVCELGKRKGAA